MDGVKRSWRDRQGLRERVEHKETVRMDIPDDVKAAFVEAVAAVASLQLKVAQIEGRVADLESLLAGLAREAAA